MSEQNYYDILGVSKDASVDEIKKAFRQKAVKYHPDQGGDEAKFKEVNQAYEILSNPEKRQRYDQFGQAGVGSGFHQEGFSDASGFSFDFGEGGLGDIFSNLFGMRREHAPQAGRDIEIVLNLDFEEAIFGVEKEISLNLNDLCPKCDGRRAQPGTKVETCQDCGGQGHRVKAVRTILGNFQQQTVCPACSGSGKDINTPCQHCRGRGVAKQKKKIHLVIPAGIEDGVTIRLRGHGEKNVGGVAGDLYAIVQVAADKHFTREGDLILSDETIDMVQAALGATIKVQTVDGEVNLKIPVGTQSGTDFRLSKKGVPHLKGGGRGDQIVCIIVVTPIKLSNRQKQLLQEFNQ